MKAVFFDLHPFEMAPLKKANVRYGHELTFLEPRLTFQTAVLARGFECVGAFANDTLNAAVLETLAAGGTRLIALRSAGFNHVDLEAAAKWGLTVVRVPEYSPYAVAEHAVALLLALNRKIHRAYHRVRELDFSLDGLVGFDLHGKTAGVIGTGRIGSVFARIMHGFGCKLKLYDRQPDPGLSKALGAEYVALDALLEASDIISLHVPLTPQTHYLVDKAAIQRTKPGVFLINTGRGALVDTRALIQGLKSGHIGAAALDVYEEEENVFFQNLSGTVLQDDVLARLLTFPNVLVTSHQAFLTHEALTNIADTTLANMAAFAGGQALENEVSAATHHAP